MKNRFAPINRIPGAILSLIPKYCDEDDVDEGLAALTHVCRGWRGLFVSHPSLWTRLDFMNVDKTRAYIERSRSLPLEVDLYKSEQESYLEDAFLLAVPHVGRFKSLTIGGTSDSLQNLTKHFSFPIHLLKELTIDLACTPTPVLDGALFGGDLSSLRTLSLRGVITHLPWNNLRNLITFELRCAPGNTIAVTQLLNFLESASHLRDITLYSMPTSSNAPLGRVISLPHLRKLIIMAHPAHSILLNHLSITTRVSLCLRFNFGGDKSPLPYYLPKTTRNLKNLFHITTVNLRLDKTEKFMRLAGPSGELYMLGYWEDELEVAPSPDLDRRILQSLNYFPLHMTRRLAIMKYKPPTLTEIDKSSPYNMLLRMTDLLTLTLTRCNNLPFIIALNPARNPSGLAPCPNLEELILYVEGRNAFNIPDLISMVKERASKDAKLRLMTIVGLGELVPGKEAFKLKEHVTRVDYRVEERPPKWDSIPDNESD
jgi:hypothetical protein